MSEEQLQFKVSAGLKNIIGKELINNEYIAIFELVKNSYDAGATHVKISFYDNLIEIEDNGHGMTKDDIINKWLFVAYSEKKEENRKESYRDKIRPHTAGAKGIGRFSCDRLGSVLEMYTKTTSESNINTLFVDWTKFEHKDLETLESINVKYYNYTDIIVFKNGSGTKLVIKNLADDWDREKVLKLKKSLRKMINPKMLENEDKFDIELYMPSEIKNDKKFDKDNSQEVINGIVENDVFEKLKIKTINIKVDINEKGDEITTTINDRGDFIYTKIISNLKYNKLHNIQIELFYLNRSAKHTFVQIMGLNVKRYGSVFVYKNNFRVLPYGEPMRDVFDIDQRKAQGHSRYLGTRDLIGRVSIFGNNPDFIETSSRADGFVTTEASEQLKKFLKEEVLVALEKYVVGIVKWADPDDTGVVLHPEDVVDSIIEEIVKKSKRENLIKFKYNENLFDKVKKSQKQKIDEYTEQLEKYAEKHNNHELSKLAKDIKEQVEVQKKSYKSAIKDATDIAEKYENELERVEIKDKQIKNLENQNLNPGSIDVKSSLHTVLNKSNIIINDVNTIMDYFIDDVVNNDLKNILIRIYSSAYFIHKVSKYGINSSIDLSSTRYKGNIITYLKNEIFKIEKYGINITVSDTDTYSYNDVHFDIVSLAIIIDNIVNNSTRAGAKQIKIISENKEEYLLLHFHDNGYGLKDILSDDELFSRGVSTTGGNGIGLYHIKMLMNEINGIVFINREVESGFDIVLGFRYE